MQMSTIAHTFNLKSRWFDETKNIEVEVGSGNVFRDLGHKNPEEALVKANLALQIHKIIKKRRLTQKNAAKILGITQPRVSDILRGRLARFSIDRLMRFIGLLGKDIEIRVKEHKHTRENWISVVEEKPSRQRAA